MKLRKRRTRKEKWKQRCILKRNLTFWKAILLHCVSVVHELKEVVPSWEPTGSDCRAIQFTSAVPFEPSPYSKTQTVNSFLVADSIQIAAPLPRVWRFSVWLFEAKTFIGCPPLKGSLKDTFSHANSPGAEVVTFLFPAFKLSAVNKKKELSLEQRFFIFRPIRHFHPKRHVIFDLWLNISFIPSLLPIYDDSVGSFLTTCFTLRLVLTLAETQL